jgi:hypothetical protein
MMSRNMGARGIDDGGKPGCGGAGAQKIYENKFDRK